MNLDQAQNLDLRPYDSGAHMPAVGETAVRLYWSQRAGRKKTPRAARCGRLGGYADGGNKGGGVGLDGDGY